MTQAEYLSIDWNRGNKVRLTNGKEYKVKGTKKNYLVLYSDEYDSHFVVDYRIIDCRTSDKVEPMPEKPAAVKPAKAVKAAPAKTSKVVKAAPVSADQPKRKRQRIVVSKVEKVNIK